MDYVGVRRVDARRRDRRRGAPARPVHHQGLRRARVRDAGAAPQAAPRARGRGPDRGLARLQGRGRAVRHVPEGRAVRRAGRRPAPRGRRAARARGHRPRAAARPPRAGRAQRLAHPRAAARRATGALLVERVRGCSRAASRPTTSRPSTCSARAQRVRVHFLVHAPDGLPEVDHARARARGRRSSRARGTTRCATRWSSATARPAGALLRSIWGRASARALQGLHGAGARRRTTSRCFERLDARTGRSWSRCSRCAEHTRVALYKRGAEGRAGRRRCRCSRTSGCA